MHRREKEKQKKTKITQNHFPNENLYIYSENTKITIKKYIRINDIFSIIQVQRWPVFRMTPLL